MSAALDAAGTAEAEVAAALQEALRGLAAPKLEVEAFAALLDEALGLASQATLEARRAAQSNSLDGTMTGAVQAILTAEAAVDTIKGIKGDIGMVQAEAEKLVAEARAALGRAFADSGCPSVETADHTATGADGGESVEITDERALPLDCVETKDVPNKRVIKARLIAGVATPGARLVQGPPGIRIAARQRNQKGARA